MRLLCSPPRILSIALATIGFATGSTGQVYIEQGDGISEPIAGSTIEGGSAFPFTFTPNVGCTQGYSNVTAYLLPGPDPPTPSSLNATQQISEGDYLAYFGSYLIPNFGLPNLPPGPPPSTFVAPILDLSYVNTVVYIVVVQYQSSCAPLGPFASWVALSSVGVTYTS